MRLSLSNAKPTLNDRSLPSFGEFQDLTARRPEQVTTPLVICHFFSAPLPAHGKAARPDTPQACPAVIWMSTIDTRDFGT